MTQLPAGWRSAPVGDVCLAVEKADPADIGRTQIRYVDIGSVDGDRQVLTEVSVLPAAEAPTRARQVLRQGDTVFSTVRPYLRKIAFIDASLEGEFASTGFSVLRPGTEVLPRYLYYFAISDLLLDQVVPLQRGVSYPAVRDKDVRAATIPLPPLNEQRRIVEILEDHLSRLDAAESELALAVTRSDRWELSALWNITHVAGAPSVRLDSIAEVKLGRQRSPRNHSGARMRPYLRAANVHWNRLRLDEVKEMNFSEAEEATFALRRGDILVVEASGSAAEVGKSAIFADEVPGACFQNTLLRVRCKSALPGFVQKYLLAEALAGCLVQESRGVGIHHIGRARLAALPIMVPDEADQTHIAEAADTVLAASERVRDEIEAAHCQGRALRQALFAAAFTGRLTGRATDEEVVQELAGV